VDEALPLPLPWPDMFRHGCPDAFFGIAPDPAAGFFSSPAVVAPDEALARVACCTVVAACVTPGDALVDALAMVRPRPRLAPRVPAAIAMPASGREILMWSPLRRARSIRNLAGSGAGLQATRRIQ
jgi:hypothetical protein